MNFEIIEREARDSFVWERRRDWEKEMVAKAKAERSELMSSTEGFLGLEFGYMGSVIFIVVGLVIFGFNVFGEPSIAKTIWSSLLMLSGYGCYWVTLPRLLRRARKEHPFVVPTEQLLPTQTVPIFLTRRIEQIKQEVLGAGSEFQRIRVGIFEVNEEARKIVGQLDIRLASGDVAYLAEARKQAQEDVAATQVTLEKFAEFKGKVDAFLTECANAVQQLQQPLSDLELVRRVAALRTRRNSLEEQARAVLTSNISLIQDRMASLRQDVRDRFERCGVQIALSAHNSGDLIQDLREIERTIDSFVPARVLEERPVEVTTNA